MAHSPELQRFYASKRWRDLRNVLIIQRHGICDRCGLDCSTDTSQLIAHHKKHLTDETLKDPNIAVNPDNIEILCPHCHALQHADRGFIKGRKQVFIVFGAPLSGKTTYVKENMEDGDLIVDMDYIYHAISLAPIHTHSVELQRTAFAVRDFLYDQIRMRNGNWTTAWVVASLPRKDERARLASRLGASTILIEATQEECIRRLINDPSDHRGIAFENVIRGWFRDYIP